MGSLYLLYGDDEAAINETKLKILKGLMPSELRAQNMTEFEPPGNRFTLSLKRVLPPLVAELSTRSMFGDVIRIAVVYNLDGFYKAESGGGKGEESFLGHFLDFLKNQFSASSNVLIFICTEKPDKGRWIDSRSPLLMYLKEAGTTRAFRSQLRQNFIDAVLARDTVRSIGEMRKWWERTKSPSPIFSALLYAIELLLQAKLVTERRRYGLAEKDLKEKFLKRGMSVSIYREFPSRQQIIMECAAYYSLKELVDAMEELLEVGVWVFPRQSDKYVPDIKLLIEKFLIEFTGGASLKAH